MKADHLNSAELQSVCATLPPKTLRELLARISVTDCLPLYRRKILAADLSRFLEIMPAAAAVRPHGTCLRPYMVRLHPVTAGISGKRISNLLANVRACLRWSYSTWPGSARRPEFSSDWMTLRSSLKARSKLLMFTSRFIHWANNNGVQPEAVNDQTFEEFICYLEATVVLKKPLAHARQVARHWNIAAETVPGWPKTRLQLPSTRTKTSAPRLSELSLEMAADLAAYTLSMKGESASPEPKKRHFRKSAIEKRSISKGTRRYSTNTIAQREQLLRRAIGLLAQERECSVTGIKSLAELVAPDAPDAILERYDVELGEQEIPPPSLRMMALAIFVMAKNYLQADSDTLDRLGSLIDEAGPMQIGMTEKNRERIRSITPEQYKALFQLPGRLIAKAAENVDSGRATTSDLIDAQTGAAIAILLHAPVRGANLVATQIDTHLFLPEQKGSEGRLTYPFDEVKNQRVLDFPLPPDVTALLLKFARDIAPNFPRSGFTNAIFPGLKNKTKGVSHLGNQIAGRVSDAIGMRLNQHFFRHLLAHIYLVRNPGRYDVVQHLLGHARIETTKKYYTGEEVEAALRDVARNLSDIKIEAGLDPSDMSRMVSSGARRRS